MEAKRKKKQDDAQEEETVTQLIKFISPPQLSDTSVNSSLDGMTETQGNICIFEKVKKKVKQVSCF